MTTFVLENFDDEELKYIGSICRKAFLIFPHYCLGRGLMDMATEEGLNAVVGIFGEWCPVLGRGYQGSCKLLKLVHHTLYVLCCSIENISSNYRIGVR